MDHEKISASAADGTDAAPSDTAVGRLVAACGLPAFAYRRYPPLVIVTADEPDVPAPPTVPVPEKIALPAEGPVPMQAGASASLPDPASGRGPSPRAPRPAPGSGLRVPPPPVARRFALIDELVAEIAAARPIPPAGPPARTPRRKASAPRLQIRRRPQEK